MSVTNTIEKVSKNEVKITVSVTPQLLEKGMQHSYNINKSKINIPGFRKGKVPRKMIEKMYGRAFLYDDAINHVLPEIYDDAIRENELEPVARPEFDVIEIDAEKGAVLTATVTIKPEVILGEYKGLTYNRPDSTVTDAEIDAEIDKVREKNSRIVNVTDRPIENGDIAVIDFEGFLNGIPFDGGKGDDYELVIGSHSFIDTFEEQLIGLNAGEEKDINVTFPDEYNNKELEGQPALFKVCVKNIKMKELPVADDEFAQDVSEFDTLDEYKNDIRAKLQEKKAHEVEHDIENQVVEQLINVCEIDIPEIMIKHESEHIVKEFEQRLNMQGIQMDMYMQYTGFTLEQMINANKDSAKTRIAGRLSLEAVAKAENFEVTDEDLDKEITRMAESYKMEKEKLATVMRDEDIKGLKIDISVKKALDMLIENAVAVEVVEQAKTE